MVDCHGDAASTTDFEADSSHCVVTDFATMPTNSRPVVARDARRVLQDDPTLTVSSSSMLAHLHAVWRLMEIEYGVKSMEINVLLSYTDQIKT